MALPSKPWDNFQPLTLIGKVVDLTVGNDTYKGVLLDNLKMPRSEEDRVQVYFITDDVLGHLTLEEVLENVDQIRDLPLLEEAQP
ncbi:MAG TPA: hypothetical protein PKI66_04855 [Methanobacteriaceae archaeon]|nr:hypothetical protein [Methanobacteriaceae archaeon]